MSQGIDVLALANKAAETDDQSKETKGFERTLPTPGLRGCRFIEYIELGKQAFKGTSKFGVKAPTDKVRLTFELLGKNDMEEIKVGEETKKVGKRVSVEITKSLSSKGDFKKIMNMLDRGRGKQHMAQMLGEAFLVKVTVVDAEGNVCTAENKKEGKYINLFTGTPDSKMWTFAAPMIEDPETGEVRQVKVMPNTSPLKIFLFDNPTVETWDSLFIEGTREVKDSAGVVTQQSKNFIQEKIMGASNYEGSALQQMLMSLKGSSDEHATAAAALLGDDSDPLAM